MVSHALPDLHPEGIRNSKANVERSLGGTRRRRRRRRRKTRKVKMKSAPTMEPTPTPTLEKTVLKDVRASIAQVYIGSVEVLVLGSFNFDIQ
jgi:hypothetical protein